MIQFLKDAVREFKHVVWPTRKETQKFFGLVLSMLIFFGVYLFLVSNIFSELIFGLKNILGTGTDSSFGNSLSEDEINAIFSDEVNIETEVVSPESTSTGSVVEEVTSSGAENQ